MAIAFIFCVIFARFFYIQVVWGQDLVYKATDQWNREIPIVARRGVIIDRNGKLLASNESSYCVFVRPNAIKDFDDASEKISQALQLDKNAILKKISGGKVSEITLARGVSKEMIEKLVSFNIDGVYYSRDNSRAYPYGDALCQTLGFTASDSSGVTGIEKYYENVLCGKNGEIMYSTDIVGIKTENSKVIYKDSVDGNCIKLTIDIDIQLASEQAMKKVYETSNAKSVSCIVLDPQNFEILSLVNYPSYDLNEVPRNDTDLLNSLTRNSLICDIYEPGSTFKVVTAAADLEEYIKGNKNAFSPSYVFNGSRTRIVDGTKIKCWSDHANGKHSNETLSDALNNSCNPCFTDIALSLGADTFYKYLSAFGLGNVTGIDFSGEALGMLVPRSLVRDCDLARIGFGQTVAVTGIQLACAVASAVNGGKYFIPHFTKAILSSDGKTAENIAPILKNTVISEKASAILREMLEGVVKEGSGKKAYIEGYRVGGKTGTAQKYENGHIASGKYVSSFVGFFPASSPKYLALIVVDEPQGVYYGSTVAAPVAKEIFEDIIAIKNLKPLE